MPIDQAKEAAKLAVETSGVWSNIWQWLLGGVCASGVAVWSHLTGRIRVLEERAVTSEKLSEHIADEQQKFEALFNRHDHLIDTVSEIRESVARIEGRLEK